MPSILKNSRRDHSAEMLAIIISIQDARKLQAQIDDYWKFAKFTITSIIYYYIKKQKRQVRLTHRAFTPSKLDDRVKRLFLHHIEQNLFDNLKTLGIHSKSDQHFS